MGLTISTIAVDSGLSWEQNLNSSLTTLDQHNHSIGNGVQIGPSGLNINGALAFNNNQATSLQAVVFIGQGSLATLNALWVGTDGNLYFNDGSSDPSIKITSGGAVNATASGIASGTASASFNTGVLVVNAATSTPGNIECASILLGNNSAGSNFVTLSPVNSLGSSYTLVLPQIPAQTNVVTLSSAGNMSSITYDAVGQDMTSTGANAIANTRTRTVASTVGVGGIAISSSSGFFTTTSTTFTAVTNLSVTITTSGRPVFVGLRSDGSGSSSSIACITSSRDANLSAQFGIYNGVSQVSLSNINLEDSSPPAALENSVPSSALWTIDTGVSGSAGTYTYTVQANINASTGNAVVAYAQLIAYEL